ncbi:MAG TPA: SDR family oxidoreductase [Mycobacteriales bacterium]|jgi:NAD(P)-dependent dehydrogenase (short-subunit alcohol dehydrogenase family)|nr:SDR family oxidoreductase [Mycobacteriales bacterium]
MPAKTALVTGASRGIGKAIAVALAHAGYDVALAARTVGRGDPTPDHTITVHHRDTRPLPGSLEETAELVEAAGRRSLRVKMDLIDLASVEAAVGEVLDAWGGVDLLVNNGRHLGPGLMDTMLDTPVEEYHKFLMAHALSPIRIIQLLLPAMMERKSGTVITISSGAGYDYYPTSPPGQAGTGLGYRLGKAAGHMLAGAVAVEAGDKGVRAFNVDPGFVLTERNALGLEDTGYDASWAAPPEAIGAVVAWIADSPEADALQPTNITAQDLALERGLYPDWRKK